MHPEREKLAKVCDPSGASWDLITRDLPPKSARLFYKVAFASCCAGPVLWLSAIGTCPRYPTEFHASERRFREADAEEKSGTLSSETRPFAFGQNCSSA
jgi:hypothetical protein